MLGPNISRALLRGFLFVAQLATKGSLISAQAPPHRLDFSIQQITRASGQTKVGRLYLGADEQRRKAEKRHTAVAAQQQGFATPANPDAPIVHDRCPYSDCDHPGRSPLMHLVDPL